MEQADGMTVTFRCPPELEPVLPRPVPAVLGLPDWFKEMPQKAFSALLQEEQLTVKKCPPFIDAMTYGFLIPLVADLRVERGAISWDRDVPGGAFSNYSRSPIDFHDSNQVAGTPLYDDDRFIIKFNNFWTIELPAGPLAVHHPSGQPARPAVRDAHRDGRCRPLSRQLHPLPGALARSGFHRRAAEGHAGRAMHSAQARELERAVRHDFG